MRFRIYRISDENGDAQPHPRAFQDGETLIENHPAYTRYVNKKIPGTEIMRPEPEQMPAWREVTRHWYIEIASPEELLEIADTPGRGGERKDHRQVIVGRRSGVFEDETAPVIELYDGWIE